MFIRTLACSLICLSFGPIANVPIHASSQEEPCHEDSFSPGDEFHFCTVDLDTRPLGKAPNPMEFSDFRKGAESMVCLGARRNGDVMVKAAKRKKSNVEPSAVPSLAILSNRAMGSCSIPENHLELMWMKEQRPMTK